MRTVPAHARAQSVPSVQRLSNVFGFRQVRRQGFIEQHVEARRSIIEAESICPPCHALYDSPPLHLVHSSRSPLGPPRGALVLQIRLAKLGKDGRHVAVEKRLYGVAPCLLKRARWNEGR